MRAEGGVRQLYQPQAFQLHQFGVEEGGLAEDGVAIGRERRGVFVEQFHVEIDHRVRHLIAQVGEDKEGSARAGSASCFQRVQIGEEAVHF